MGTREQLQRLINKDWEQLPKIMENYRKRNPENSSLEEAIQDLNGPDLQRLWASIYDLFSSRIINKYFNKENLNFPENCTDTEENPNQSSEEDKENDYELLESLLKLASVQIDIMLSDKRQQIPPEKLTQLVVLIGGLLSEFEHTMQKLAVSLCEKWIVKGLEGKDKIYSSTLLTLVKNGLEFKAKKQDVKRVWMIHPDLTCLPLKSSEDAQSSIGKLLISCVSSSNYLSCDEGIKFLSLILLTPVLVKDFHNSFKNSLPTLTKAQSVKFAEIYFRAWKESQGDLKKKIEEDCLQDLMYLAVHVDPFASRASLNLMAFLHQLHKNKKHVPTATVIYSLYEPFIWRSLKVANGYVRMNAATIFCDAYPFIDMSLNQQEKETFEDKQYQAFLTLLVDPCHLVRIVTIKGVFLLLNDYWLMTPSHIIQKIFHIFISQLIIDASSAEVRVEVIKGISRLLDCPDAGPFLSEILPRLSDCFDDVNASVRIAFVKLLIKVKSTCFLKYWKLVPLEHLLIRMVADIPNIRTLIAHLIQSSFILSNFEEQDMLLRCISLIEMNREASRRFYQYAGKKVELEPITRFILFIWRTLHRYVQAVNSRSSCQASASFDDSSSQNLANGSKTSQSPTEISKKQKSKPRTKGNKENSAPNAGTTTEEILEKKHHKDDLNESSKLPLDDPNIVGGLLDTIIIIWTVNAPRLGLQHNFKYLDALRTRISKTFPAVWSFFKECDEISQTLLYLASFLPSSIMPTMVGLCISRLKSISDNGNCYSSDESYTTYLNSLSNWNRVDDIMELISEWLEGAFSLVLESPQSFNKKKSKVARVGFQEKITPKPLLALKFLYHVLVHPLNKMVLLQKNRHSLLQVCSLLSNVKALISKRITLEAPISAICSDEFILKAWEDYLCIVSLLKFTPSSLEIENSNSNLRPRRAEKSGTLGEECNAEEFNSAVIHCENIDFMLRILTDLNMKNYSMVSLVNKCAFGMLKSGSDFVTIGNASFCFIDKYLNYSKCLIKHYSEFHLGESVSSFIGLCCQGISEVHQFLCVYSENDSHLLPVRSCTEQTLNLLMAFISQTTSGVSNLNDKDCLSTVDSLTKTITVLMQHSDLLLDTISLHLVNRIVDAMTQELKKHLGAVPVLHKVTDLPNEAKILLLSMHKNTKIAESFMEALKLCFTQENPDICDLLAATLLLALLMRDSGRVSQHSLKEVAYAAYETLGKIDEPLTNEPTNESTNESTNEPINEYTVEEELFRYCAHESKKIMEEITANLGLVV